jgi:hypothetical protein
MFSYKTIKNERQWKATVGLSSKSFHCLTIHFTLTYAKLNGVSLNEAAENLKSNLLLPTYEDCLFYVLFQLKNGLSYDSLGFLIGTDGVNAERNFEKYLAILDICLTELGHMPRRDFKTVEEFESYLETCAETELVLDATEHPTERPKGYSTQKATYSGKKRDTPTKNSF